MSRIIFYNRDFTGTLAINADVTLERYSHHMIGGPETAQLTAKPNADKWELTKLLRCPVEIYGADGGIKWWGYVNRVTVPHGKMRIGVGLDELYNSISIKYDSGTTSAALDTQSTTEYGVKQYFVNQSNATLTEAQNYRNSYLSNHKYAVPEIELSGGDETVKIECYGWWKSLDWKYYTNASTTSIDDATQIRDIITSCGQFIRGTIVQNSAGITSNPMRDGSQTGLTYIEELLEAGTSNARPLLAYVDRDRYIHLYERGAESPEYVMQEDGNVKTLLGRTIEPERCLSAVWMRARTVPDVLGGISAMRPFFIERAEYTFADDYTRYQSADAFEQRRLNRYVRRNTPHSTPSGSYGGSYVPPTVGTPDYAFIVHNGGTGETTGHNGITIVTNSIASHNLTYEFEVSQDGLYWMAANADWNFGDSIAINPFVGIAIDVNTTQGYANDNENSTDSPIIGVSVSGPLELTAGDNVKAYTSHSTLGSLGFLDDCSFGLVRLGDLPA